MPPPHLLATPLVIYCGETEHSYVAPACSSRTGLMSPHLPPLSRYRVPRSDEMFTRASPASPGKLVSLDGPWRQRAPPPRPPSHHHPSLLRRCCWRRQEGASKVSPGGEAVEGSEGGLTPRP